MKMEDYAKGPFDELMKIFKDSGQYDFLEKLTEDELWKIFLLITFLNLYRSNSVEKFIDAFDYLKWDRPETEIIIETTFGSGTLKECFDEENICGIQKKMLVITAKNVNIFYMNTGIVRVNWNPVGSSYQKGF